MHLFYFGIKKRTPRIDRRAGNETKLNKGITGYQKNIVWSSLNNSPRLKDSFSFFYREGL
jgi:hypothetical protein